MGSTVPSAKKDATVTGTDRDSLFRIWVLFVSGFAAIIFYAIIDHLYVFNGANTGTFNGLCDTGGRAARQAS